MPASLRHRWCHAPCSGLSRPHIFCMPMPPDPHQNQMTMVALSGGVDSSVAALLLQQRQRPIAAMFMKNWEEDDRLGACSAAADAADAAAVADLIGIKLYQRNFAAEYWEGVFENFLAEYRAGRTPNPDILCNREIKFKTFLEHARDAGAERIATGHYVRTDQVDGRHRLLRGRDDNKDQSYFLYTLGQRQLACAEFPVGELHKAEVRKCARAAGLQTHDKKDSTGICFIGERNFRAFLGQYLPARPGEIRTAQGQLVGEHQGLMFHTLGQRRGLGLGGIQGCPEAPWYVLHKDLKGNILYVGQDHQHPWLMSTLLSARHLSWVCGTPPLPGARLEAQVRYRQSAQACQLRHLGDDRMVIEFDGPQRAVTPGQSVVLYAGDECLGGGIIEGCNAPHPQAKDWSA